MTFTLATWNINSVRLREGLVVKLMAEESPDILCLQECKSPVEMIPVEQFRALGLPLHGGAGAKGLQRRGDHLQAAAGGCWAAVILSPWVMRGMWRRGWKMAW